MCPTSFPTNRQHFPTNVDSNSPSFTLHHCRHTHEHGKQDFWTVLFIRKQNKSIHEVYMLLCIPMFSDKALTLELFAGNVATRNGHIAKKLTQLLHAGYFQITWHCSIWFVPLCPYHNYLANISRAICEVFTRLSVPRHDRHLLPGYWSHLHNWPVNLIWPDLAPGMNPQQVTESIWK